MSGHPRHTHGLPPAGRPVLLLGVLLAGLWVSGAYGPEAAERAEPGDPPTIHAAAGLLRNPVQGRGDTLHIGVVYAGDFRPLPPAMLADEVERWIMTQVYGPGLLKPRLNDPLIPDLAQEVSYVETGGRITFTIPRGIRFQNNEVLTLEHLQRTFLIYRGLGWIRYPTADPAFTHIDSTLIDPARNQFSLWMPASMLQQGFRIATAPILADAIMAGVPLTGDPVPALLASAEAPVGLGGYAIRVRDGRVFLTAFEGYFGGRPDIRNIVIHFYPDDSALIRAFVTGEVQFARCPTFKAVQRLNGEVATSRRRDQHVNLRFFHHPDHFFFLALNNTVAPLDDPVMRRVFANIIHREDFDFRDEFPAHSVITDVPVHPRSALGAYLPTPTRRHQPRSFVLRQLQESDLALTRTGYPRAADGGQFHLELIYPQAAEHYERMARWIKNDLEGFQFLIDVTPLPPDEVRRRLGTGEYDLALSEMTLPPTVDTLYRLFYSENIAGGLNITRFSNPAFDTNIKAALLRGGPDAEPYLETAIRILYENVPLLPLFFQANIYCFFDSDLVDQAPFGANLTLMPPMAAWRWK